ncbi:MAG TPA: indolepyruvate oxidoreductase subunit beta [Candidatus Merdivicinus excrementipullorum]|uniref:Indolepyruvate oxidoreductase subunit beta n=1 Tax=Candidatus Merdivicinus excrementipullorum TaxID=2840867 RepID=A0A9D1FLQ9_9FIRM|nr:indolepyruvate oxidoreductase subunit beta [Candidatus Merdivicinus excrementipullorum]
MNKSIMIVGVGGQGSLLASKMLGHVVMQAGYDVKVSEVHGMSQRGGSVVTYVKYSDEKVWSPVINEGEADIIISFELLEAARWVGFLKKDGAVVVNNQEIAPMPVITGAAVYPENIGEKLSQIGVNLKLVDALKLAEEAGSAKATNVVLMGAVANVLDFPEEMWQKAIDECVPPKFLELNRKAFALGRQCR